MRPGRICTFVLVFSAFPLCCPHARGEIGAPRTITMSLADAVAIALRNNKELRIQEQEIRAARAERLGALSNFLPKAGVTGGYTHNSAVLGRDFPFPVDSDKDIGIFTGFLNEFQAGLSASESIYAGGGNYAALKKAALGIIIQEETLRAKKLDVEFDAKRLYYGLLLAFENLTIAQDLLAQAKAHCEEVRRKYSQGTSSRFDLLQSQVHVSLLIPPLVQAQNAIDLIDAELKKLLSLSLADRLALKGRLEQAPVAVDEAAFMKRAAAGRPEMILKSLGVDVSAWAVRQARATRLPQVSASVNTMFSSDSPGNMFNSTHNLWNAGVSVAIPVFDGFYTKSKVDEAWARYAQADLSRENVAEQTAVDVRRACLDLRRAQAVIDSQRDNIAEAREALRISEVSYDNGVGTNLDVLDSLVSLSQAEQYYVSGLYDYIMARAYLERTMGEHVAAP